MRKTDVFPVLPSVSLADLQTIIAQTEALKGPLIAISSYGREVNWLVFLRGEPSSSEIMVELLPADTEPPSRDGYVPVCIGDCVIENGPQGIAVYRKAG